MRVQFRLLAAGLVILGLGAATRAQQPPATPAPPSSQPPAAQPPPGTQPPAGQRPPVIRSGINFVSVDVIISDKKTGDVVLDMKQDDFDLREDKKPQKVETFDVVKIDPLAFEGRTPREIRSSYDEESEAPKSGRKSVVILGSGPNRIGQGVEIGRASCRERVSNCV